MADWCKICDYVLQVLRVSMVRSKHGWIDAPCFYLVCISLYFNLFVMHFQMYHSILIVQIPYSKISDLPIIVILDNTSLPPLSKNLKK